MAMSPEDSQYFRDFAEAARARELSLADYYIAIQRSHRNERGGVTVILPTELHGLELARAHLQPQDSCLIMGCGNGVEASWLLANGIRNLTGLDIAEALLVTCEKTLGIKTVRADMRQTGLPEQSYDVVMTHRSLHHLFYPFQCFEELARVARKRVMLLNEPVRSALKTAIRAWKKQRIISAANIYEYQFDRDDVHRYMAFNGFRLVKAIRYWEVCKGPLTNRLLNAFGRPAGNRFSAIYERLSLAH